MNKIKNITIYREDGIVYVVADCRDCGATQHDGDDIYSRPMLHQSKSYFLALQHVNKLRQRFKEHGLPDFTVTDLIDMTAGVPLVESYAKMKGNG